MFLTDLIRLIVCIGLKRHLIGDPRKVFCPLYKSITAVVLTIVIQHKHFGDLGVLSRNMLKKGVEINSKNILQRGIHLIPISLLQM